MKVNLEYMSLSRELIAMIDAELVFPSEEKNSSSYPYKA